MDMSEHVSAPPQDRGDQQGQPQISQEVEQKTEPPLEVFCGRIPRDMTEDEIRDLFAIYGPITEMRVATDPITHLNKGYAFISFLRQDDALKAIAKVNGKQVRHRQYLKVTRCLPNTRLFIGNIPKAKAKQQLHAEFALRTEGLKEVIIYKSPDDAKKNRGFCFLDYESHKAAAKAKRKLSTEDTKVWGCDILVDWADAQQEVDPDTMSKVRIIYARNISAMVMENELWSMFEAFGPLERVKKIKDYAFIHFVSRDDAKTAMEALNGLTLRNVAIELQWAKPPTDKETRQNILRARERRLIAQQALRPVRGAVNPFPQPIRWDEDDDCFYPRRGGGDYQECFWPPWSPPEPTGYFRPGYSAGPEPQGFFDDQFPYNDYPLPRLSPSAFVLDRSDDEETFSGSIPTWNHRIPSGTTQNGTNARRTAAERDQNWRTNATIQRRRQWTNQNHRTNLQSHESDQENWRNRP